jgi:glutathione synthase/RimK-type ligase-like ATP-grasp enzyme
MKKLALLTCNEIDENACNDDELLLSPLKEMGIEASFEIWNDKTVNWSKYDYCIIRSTWDYTEDINEFLSFLKEREKHLKVFNSLETVMNNYNKKYLLKLEENGFEIVPSLLLDRSISSLLKAQEKFNTKKIISKPLVGAGASGLLVHNGEEIIDESKDQFLFQPFLNSIQSDGEISLIFFNEEFSHAIKKVPKAGDFRSQEEFGSNITEYKPNQETLNYSMRVLKEQYPNTLFARIDLLKNESGEWRLIGEVELIEPALYLSFSRNASENFSRAISSKLN